MSMQMRWKNQTLYNRKRFVSFCAYKVKKDFYKAKQWIEEGHLDGTPGVDIRGIIDHYLQDYVYDVEWCSTRQFSDVRKDILNTAYSNAKLDQRLNKIDRSDFLEYLEKKLRGE